MNYCRIFSARNVVRHSKWSKGGGDFYACLRVNWEFHVLSLACASRVPRCVVREKLQILNLIAFLQSRCGFLVSSTIYHSIILVQMKTVQRWIVRNGQKPRPTWNAARLNLNTMWPTNQASWKGKLKFSPLCKQDIINIQTCILNLGSQVTTINRPHWQASTLMTQLRPT